MIKLGSILKAKVREFVTSADAENARKEQAEQLRLADLKKKELENVEKDLQNQIPKQMVQEAILGHEGYEYSLGALEDPETVIARIKQWAAEQGVEVTVSALAPKGTTLYDFDFSWTN